MEYDSKAPDGQRLVVTFSKESKIPLIVRPSIWDWELIPLVGFVGSEFDAAFSWFGERSKAAQTALPNARAVAYHPAFKDTLLGLRLMQLDLYLFLPEFLGSITDSRGEILLGPGEQDAMKWQSDPRKAQAAKREREANQRRRGRALSILENECMTNPSKTCRTLRQPYQSYVVGDILSPVSFDIVDGRLKFETKGVCWDFARPTEPDEASTKGLPGTVRLTALSESFCSDVRGELAGIYPLVYRAGNRALLYSALLRHFKRQDRGSFLKFKKSLTGVSVPQGVVTPTEIFVR